MITARYATASRTRCEGSHACRSSRPWIEVADPRGERRREDAVREHRQPDVDREQRRVLERGHELVDLVRQRRRVQRQAQGDAHRDERDRADLVAAREHQVAEHDRRRERDGELEEVAPRPAPDDHGTDGHRREEERERPDRQPARRARERARRREVGGSGRRDGGARLDERAGRDARPRGPDDAGAEGSAAARRRPFASSTA